MIDQGCRSLDLAILIVSVVLPGSAPRAGALKRRVAIESNRTEMGAAPATLRTDRV
jgi:hypothetical protein